MTKPFRQQIAGFAGIKGFLLFLVHSVLGCTDHRCLHSDGRSLAP
jgi:hypothetical protein